MSNTFSHYKLLPAMVGPFFLPVAFLARLPLSMNQIGTVVLVSTKYHSVGFGGVVAGFLSLGSAAGGPLIGSLADRLGQRWVMLIACLLNATAILATVALVVGHAPIAAVCVLAAVTGWTTPQIGPMMRARWVHLTRGTNLLGYAMSYEGAADETAYVLGPAAVSVATVLGSPVVAVVVAAVLVGLFGSAVALHPSGRFSPAKSRVPDSLAESVAPQPGWRNPRVLALMVGALAIGCFFGSMQTGVTGMATHAGLAKAAGGIYAVMGIGSAVAGLACAALPARFGLSHRLTLFAATIAVLTVPTFFVATLLPTTFLLVVLGCAVGPYIITLMSLAQREVPPDRAASVMTLLASAMVVGYPIGSTIGGSLVDSSSPAAAFMVAGLAMLVGTLVSLKGAFATRVALVVEPVR